ncbi:DUF2510 domain-containing protein [Paraoerskovia marina]|uniref:DUF2510 domain-containing protein n=1 Tax=Paraoerskovia marina TaxID=545619 RepID=UPI0004926271|nr:DUF2510 domain-containing protein [Paraoerskovia marina]
MNAPAAGWYPDPQDQNIDRYFDGTAWTTAVRQRETLDHGPTDPVEPGGAKRSGKGWLIAGISTAVLVGLFVVIGVAAGGSDDEPVAAPQASSDADPVEPAELETETPDETPEPEPEPEVEELPSPDEACEVLGTEAVRIAADQADGFTDQLIKVRQPEMVEDNRLTYEIPTDTSDALIYSCTGTGIYSSGDDATVNMEATVDSDGDWFIYFEPVVD